MMYIHASCSSARASQLSVCYASSWLVHYSLPHSLCLAVLLPLTFTLPATPPPPLAPPTSPAHKVVVVVVMITGWLHLLINIEYVMYMCTYN